MACGNVMLVQPPSPLKIQQKAPSLGRRANYTQIWNKSKVQDGFS
jgi:hypothetical protein